MESSSMLSKKGLKDPIDDKPLDAGRKPYTLEVWILEIRGCNMEGRGSSADPFYEREMCSYMVVFPET